MTQYDCYRLGSQLVVDIQSDLLSGLVTRTLVPLKLLDQPGAPPPIQGLNPVVTVEGRRYFVEIQGIVGKIPIRQLGHKVGSLEGQQDPINAAYDLLRQGI